MIPIRMKIPPLLHRRKKKVSSQGPYIICIDTSGSMREGRERLAKSAVLAIARLTEATSRKCYVYQLFRRYTNLADS